MPPTAETLETPLTVHSQSGRKEYHESIIPKDVTHLILEEASTKLAQAKQILLNSSALHFSARGICTALL